MDNESANGDEERRRREGEMHKKCQIAMNLTETIMVTPSGDVLVCRCRESSSQYFTPAPKEEDAEKSTAMMTPNDLVSMAPWCLGGPCSPCAGQTQAPGEGVDGGDRGKDVIPVRYEPKKGGLLGGKIESAQKQSPGGGDGGRGGSFGSGPSSSSGSEGQLLQGSKSPDDLGAVPSFDYTLTDYHDDTPSPQEQPPETSLVSQLFQTFMPSASVSVEPNEKQRDIAPPEATTENVRRFPDARPMHGVPTFLNSLSKIQIRQVSANPFGSHVLMISSEALLFSYGQNHRGQLGLGFASIRFVTTPTIVTPLLENGGKATCCAAGADHSLVVVQTEERRIRPSRHSQQDTTDNEAREPTMYQQQLYGFGGNDHMKLGLVNPPTDVTEDVVLPHRVGLHAKVGPDTNQGILQVAAGVFHSAALVRKPSRSVEVYTWGCAGQGALGLPAMLRDQQSMSPKLVGCPVPVEKLSYIPTLNEEDCTTLLLAGEYSMQIAAGASSTFVLTSEGRCFSFGTSADGMLGQGDTRSCFEPTEVDSTARFESICPGAKHVVATTKEGNVYRWGVVPSSSRLVIEGAPKLWKIRDWTRVACAGPDGSVFLTDDGCVKSCGIPSGRLGQGEVCGNLDDAPKQMFGGLRLWYSL